MKTIIVCWLCSELHCSHSQYMVVCMYFRRLNIYCLLHQEIQVHTSLNSFRLSPHQDTLAEATALLTELEAQEQADMDVNQAGTEAEEAEPMPSETDSTQPMTDLDELDSVKSV